MTLGGNSHCWARRLAWVMAAALGVSPASGADEVADAGHVIFDARARYEHVEQDGLDDSDALTVRARLGYERPLGRHIRVLGEVEGVGHLNSDFADTVRNRPGQAIVADPEALEINRLQATYTGIEGLTATIGRQRIILNNARFVGNVGFRQNEQTFDAARLVYSATPNLTLSYAYIDRVRRIFGDDSPQGEWRSDSHIVQLDATTPMGALSAYALFLDFRNAAMASSTTYGARWTRSFEIAPYRIALLAEGARQVDYRGNTPDFAIHYAAGQVRLGRGAFDATLGAEWLEGDGAHGFATPLATLHAFQGWADVFLTTPPDGVRDLNAAISWTLREPPVGQSLQLVVRAHDFASDDGDADFGHEVDALARLQLTPRVALEAKVADYDGDNPRFPDRTRAWLALEVSY